MLREAGNVNARFAWQHLQRWCVAARVELMGDLAFLTEVGIFLCRRLEAREAEGAIR